MGNQLGDVTTNSKMSRLVMKYSSWLWGPFLGYNTNCMDNQLEDSTTNSKAALAFPTCAPCDCDQNRVQFDKVPYKG